MIKALIKKLYFKFFPDRADISKERVDELERALNPLTDNELSVSSSRLEKKTIQTEWIIPREEYEIYRHNPDYMKFIKDRLSVNIVKGLEDRIEVRTDYNELYQSTRIVGRFEFWEEIK